MTRAYVGIGSNIEPERNVRSAVRALRERFGAVALSPVYRSAAVGFDGDDFLNLVVALDVSETLPELAAALSDIERAHGRERGAQRFTARTLDLDILTFGGAERDERGRVLPRDEILRYAFVLRPLAELAPDDRHPALGQSYRELWQSFEAAAQPPLERFEVVWE